MSFFLFSLFVCFLCHPEMLNVKQEEVIDCKAAKNVLEVKGMTKDMELKDLGKNSGPSSSNVVEVGSSVYKGNDESGTCGNVDEDNKQVTTILETEEQAAKSSIIGEEFYDGMKRAANHNCRNNKTEDESKYFMNEHAEGSADAKNEESSDVDLSTNCKEINETSKVIVEALYWRRKTVAEDAERLLAEANQTKIETPGEESHATAVLKRKLVEPPGDNNFNKRMAYETRAKKIVQDVFNRIGCYENFVRRADWADETTTASGDLGTTLVDNTYEEVWHLINRTLL